ncbi:hypothetical protein LTR91_022603 [Friedmanniomyces endolithicus]|uniref:N-acetyltransferase domain-containing protein n=1 Tax=Friedmanniomyces endolithicus TaxID=329885 RepID=A0AAN6K2A4_9PEZI|nr:hypothetical protein LTR94_011153 [Friedmanniomyces endolithicus]KAK0791315.1 hypothetical protein LTR75_011810 [Friedmanniomyces endolithicus]KAK0797973.1 hypothetical protein LTR59_006638 [Friedmanniomyces endolithicus]KAK0806889.1 hypothetical protein LTR38_005041 [Friedmanniomyces endolithicus]KAK0838014.1 hypothetical protein LTR03_012339 [Friedmanniomyces endolithicus]
MDPKAYHIANVESNPQDLADVAELFEAYAKSLGIDLTFQDFTTELANLPGKYAAPTGALLLARNAQGEAIGCLALRLLPEPGYCEMKRLYVAPGGRGAGLGRALAEHMVRDAVGLGYKVMRLDTLQQMGSARALYSSLGFREVEAYYDTPIEGTVFLELSLSNG